MIRLILTRLAMAVPVFLVMTVLTFVLVSLVPGDAATTLLGQDATPEKIAALNRQLGLDRPLWQQYGDWLAKAAHGDLGTSIYTGDAVTRTLSQRILPTVFVAGFATVIAAIVGVALGMAAAVRGGALARLIDIVGMLGISLPNFWIALLLVAIVAGSLGWFPAIGYVSPSEDFAAWVSHLTLPVASLSVAGVAIIAKQSRDAIVEALSRDFVRFLQANGIPPTSLLFRHVLRYAAVPIVSATAAAFINLSGGTVALETVFAIPGLGSLVATSTLQHDLTAIQGAVLSFTMIVIAVTLISDAVNAALNPRMRTA